jgi:CheY-like chemotaxis protein
MATVRPRILIVDDNPANLRLATDVLEDAGCDIHQAVDAEQALAMLSKLQPDLIVMDIALPGMDGLTLTRKLKADPRLKDVPIVAVTASAMKGDDKKALAAGCHAYVTKPIDTRRFAQTILAYLPSAAVQSTATQIILIADDYPANLTLLRAQLEAEGLSVREANNGIEALEVLQREHVDAVISDILMPGMDGFRLCHEIRKSEQSFATVPFILYTATYNSPSDRELARTVGADDYIIKPAPGTVLIEALRKASQHSARPAHTSAQRPDDSYVLEQYSAALVRKLEERNTELQQALEVVQSANERIKDLNQHLEARVAERTAELEATNRALDSFSHSVAHDLRAPLSHIILYADLLQETVGSKLDAAGRANLDVIINAGERMARLISDLLQYAHSGRGQLQPARVELQAVLEEAIEAVRPEVDDRRIEWVLAPLPAVRGDHAMLRQVFINLLSNALKYSRERDPIRIEISAQAEEGGEIVVQVRDNGIGFDMGRAGGLFQVFHRLHPDSGIEGTGIGLASAHQVITRHGGRMWAEAAVDRGATFFFSLPGAGETTSRSPSRPA